MGNHSSREEGTNLLNNRCPERNRRLSNSTSKEGRNDMRHLKIHSSKEGMDGKMIFLNEQRQVSSKRNLEFQPLYADRKEHMKQDHKRQIRKKREQKNLLSRKFDVTPENSSEAGKFERCKKSKPNKKKRQKSKKRDQKNLDLILSTLETIANLEATFIEEKKYERRLFTAVEAQIQEIQRFNLLLDKEKGQNKKLLALLDCSTETSLQIADRKMISRNLCASMSPLLLQQTCDELAASLDHCKAELSNKSKEFNLAQYKLNELQGSCDTVTKELQDSCKKIETLNQEIIDLKQERKHLKKEIRSFRQNDAPNSGVSYKFSNRRSDRYCNEEGTAVNKKLVAIKAKAD